MFDIQNYASFIAAILIFQLIPGPGTLAILTATARHGIGAGFGAVMGTLLGDFIYMSGAVLGLATVMHAYPLVFEALQGGWRCLLGLAGHSVAQVACCQRSEHAPTEKERLALFSTGLPGQPHQSQSYSVLPGLLPAVPAYGCIVYYAGCPDGACYAHQLFVSGRPRARWQRVGSQAVAIAIGA